MNGRGYGVQFGPPHTPQVIKNLILANVVVFVAQNFAPQVTNFGVDVPALVWSGQFWRPFTYMWLHGGLLHIAGNMFMLWMFGSSLAAAWGDQRFLRYYLTCGFGAGFIIAAMPYLAAILGMGSPAEMRSATLGASGAVMAVLLAFSFTWPDRTIMLIFPPIPIKAIWLIPLALFLEYAAPAAHNISHLGHLGGVFVGWIYLLNEGRTPGAPTLQSLGHRYRRYRMRQKLRSVRNEQERDHHRWRQ